MITSGLIGLVLAALTAAAALILLVLLRRRRLRAIEAHRPRTVGDLVRMRAEAAAAPPAASPAVTSPAAASPAATSAGATPVTAPGGTAATGEHPPAPGAEVRQADQPSSQSQSWPRSVVVPPSGSGSPAIDSTHAPGIVRPVPEPALTGDDTPWGRAARMAAAAGVHPPTEPAAAMAAEPVAVEPVAVELVEEDPVAVEPVEEVPARSAPSGDREARAASARFEVEQPAEPGQRDGERAGRPARAGADREEELLPRASSTVPDQRRSDPPAPVGAGEPREAAPPGDRADLTEPGSRSESGSNPESGHEPEAASETEPGTGTEPGTEPGTGTDTAPVRQGSANVGPVDEGPVDPGSGNGGPRVPGNADSRAGHTEREDVPTTQVQSTNGAVGHVAPGPDGASGHGPEQAGTAALPARPVLLAAASGPAVLGAADPDPEIAAPAGAFAVRRGRDQAGQAAEQAAADLALLRTFGFADPSLRPESGPVVSLVSAVGQPPEPDVGGRAQAVRFRATRRDGSPVGQAALTLLDDRGREVSTATSARDGSGELRIPQQGSYVVVSVAPGHLAGAVAVTVADGPAAVEVLLTRSASVAGQVRGQDGPVAGARVTLLQDGEVVGTVDTGPDGDYVLADLSAGEYGLSVAAGGCAPVVVRLLVPDEADLRHDVDLPPAAAEAGGAPSDAMVDALRDGTA